MDVLDDAAIESRLRAASSDCWGDLWSATDKLLASEGPHSEWIFNSGQLPYIRYSDEVNVLLAALDGAGVVVEFPWRQWDGLSRYEAGQGLAEAPVAESIRVLSVMINSERFVTGIIAHLLEDGTLAVALERLRTWHGEQPAGAPARSGRADERRRRRWRLLRRS
ncbi:DUF6508 domain-containing protein [Nocardia miyunensis]|uniref:DUF6508 domain-containing protein n=1 Tax=Nocardia miyunensis TaxID=282684 RepID=UPI000835933D|nr:DUF6508 domain-containing protein [Nocardia miyunensis]